jgi:hypothetical protein
MRWRGVNEQECRNVNHEEHEDHEGCGYDALCGAWLVPRPFVSFVTFVVPS